MEGTKVIVIRPNPMGQWDSTFIDFRLITRTYSKKNIPRRFLQNAFQIGKKRTVAEIRKTISAHDRIDFLLSLRLTFWVKHHGKKEG